MIWITRKPGACPPLVQILLLSLVLMLFPQHGTEYNKTLVTNLFFKKKKKKHRDLKQTLNIIVFKGRAEWTFKETCIFAFLSYDNTTILA